MQNCLRAIGLNPKNNVVDITNFVLHELGQPLHSFDADRIAGGRVVVKTCAEGTKFVTLDGVERTLSERDLMICDAEKPMCIAGVMGGRDSGVSDATVNIFLESAYFNPVWIRKSARRHGINSDASFRFERGIDPNITIYALKRAALLIQELAGGRITSGIADTVSVPDITEPFRFDVGYDRINALTGKEIPQATVKEILGALEVRIEAERDGVLSVAVPPYRVDVRRPADLTEEILRIYGYNNIEVPARVRSAIALEKRPGREQIANRTAEYLTANGFSEIMSNSLTKLAYYEGLTEYPADGCVKILNPLSADLNAMRQTLLFNAMEAVALNTNHRNPNLKLYEFGNVYRYDASRAAEGGLAPYSENYRLGVVMTGLTETVSWNEKAAPATFFSLRAVAENLLGRFGMDIYRLVRPAGGGLFPRNGFRPLRPQRPQTYGRRVGASPIPGGQARPRPAAGQGGYLRPASGHRFLDRTEAAPQRDAVRRVRGRQTACRKEVVCARLCFAGQGAYSHRPDNRPGDEQPPRPVRETGRGRGQGIVGGCRVYCNKTQTL